MGADSRPKSYKVKSHPSVYLNHGGVNSLDSFHGASSPAPSSRYWDARSNHSGNVLGRMNSTSTTASFPPSQWPGSHSGFHHGHGASHSADWGDDQGWQTEVGFDTRHSIAAQMGYGYPSKFLSTPFDHIVLPSCFTLPDYLHELTTFIPSFS